jgi:hypothetical protein
MLPQIPTHVQVLDGGRNFRFRKEVKELGHNRAEEVLACLGGLLTEIEEVVEVRNASIMRVPLEMTDSSGALVY